MFPSARITDQSFQVSVEILLCWCDYVSGGLESLERTYWQLSRRFAICWGPQKLPAVSFRLHPPYSPSVMGPEFVKVVLEKGDTRGFSLVLRHNGFTWSHLLSTGRLTSMPPFITWRGDFHPGKPFTAKVLVTWKCICYSKETFLWKLQIDTCVC